MKLAVFSDLHLEFYNHPVEEGPIPPALAIKLQSEVDAVVLAGDISTGISGIEWADQMFPDVPVIYVAGNHEFYGREILSTVDKCRKAESHTDNLYFLENNTIEINGYTIFGSTLWTDFKANGEPWKSKMIAKKGMNDFRIIKHGEERFSPEKSIEYFERSVKYIQATKPDIVVTHHGPHMGVQPPQFRYGDLAPAFTSDLSDMDVPIWICGHTHFCCDFEDKGTRYISNQAGYPHEMMPEFDKQFIVEV